MERRSEGPTHQRSPILARVRVPMQSGDRGYHGSVKGQRPLTRTTKSREMRAPMRDTAPTTTEPQRLRALSRANEIRLERAVLKRRIASGEVSAAEVILNPPQSAETWSVGDLLMSQRRWGQTRCRKFLSQVPMSEKKTIGSMTERQRHTLAALLTSVNRGRAWTATPWLTDSLKTA